jgi:hypothetical protein
VKKPKAASTTKGMLLQAVLLLWIADTLPAAKKPKDDPLTPMEDVQDEDEPRKRTSSRIQSKGKSNDLSRTSDNVSSSKPSAKSSSQKAPEIAAKRSSGEEDEDTDLRARIKEMTSEIAKVGQSHLAVGPTHLTNLTLDADATGQTDRRAR